MNKFLYCLYCIVFVIGSYCHSSAQIINTFAGSGSAGYSGNGGAATLARFNVNTCLAIDRLGNIYINDQFNNCVRKVATDGIITTVAGNGLFGSSGDGGPATAARFGQNWGMAVDDVGNIYIADQENDRVRKVGTDGIVYTIAGTGLPGHSGDGGPAIAAQLRTPLGVTSDAMGNVYVGDVDNRCIRKIDPSGIISTYAGIPGAYGYSGDGGMATAAKFSDIWGMTTDVAGNLYVCDGGNNRVRKISTAGIITTVAGNGTSGFSGDGGPAVSAQLNMPLDVFVAKNGVIYISDCKNQRVRKINQSGIISTIAGTGTASYNGDGIPATAAHLHDPIGIVMDTNENIYVSDLYNVRIRKIVNILAFVNGDSKLLNVCKNSGPVSIDDELAIRDEYIGLTDVWTLETPAVHGTASVGYTALSGGGVITPSGLTYTPYTGYSGMDSFKVKVANSLSSDIITIYVSVDPTLSAGLITGPVSVCYGDTIRLFNSVAGGTWNSVNGYVSITTGVASCVVKGITAGIDTVRYTVTNSCGTAFASKAIVVHPLPDQGTLSGAGAICMGSSALITSTVGGGTWSTSNLNVSILPMNMETCQVKGLLAGTATVIYTVYNDWCAAAAIHIMKIETFPDAGSLTGPVSVCVGGQIWLQDTVDGGIWSSDNGLATVNNGAVTGISVGNEYINYSITNSCGTDITTWPVAVYPLPSIPVVSFDKGVLWTGKEYASYQWRMNAVDIAGAVYDSFYIDAAGNYDVVVTNNYGCGEYSQVFDYKGCSVGDLNFYPNPASDILHVVWCKKVSVRIITADGREVEVVNDASSLSLKDLASGVYFVSVYDGNGIRIKTQKIVKVP
ncbi:MAG: T9SS type A sorting domain-containing protein [Taibaiella sp.]|nr:T9SS type A sorting domain-containing protein [Taibaiella sp.]